MISKELLEKHAKAVEDFILEEEIKELGRLVNTLTCEVEDWCKPVKKYNTSAESFESYTRQVERLKQLRSFIDTVKDDSTTF